MKRTRLSRLGKPLQELVAAADAATKTSYSPYSRFAVGAALMTPDGEIVTGSNVENAAYGSTICAERAALVRANAMGYRVFKALAVAARAAGARRVAGGDVAAPCGACRQMLYEAASNAGRNIEVILLGADGKTVVLTSVAELLPLAFGGSKKRGGSNVDG
ncbi:MAG: cytidine deaminase [bacterium]